MARRIVEDLPCRDRRRSRRGRAATTMHWSPEFLDQPQCQFLGSASLGRGLGLELIDFVRRFSIRHGRRAVPACPGKPFSARQGCRWIHDHPAARRLADQREAGASIEDRVVQFQVPRPGARDRSELHLNFSNSLHFLTDGHKRPKDGWVSPEFGRTEQLHNGCSDCTFRFSPT